MAISVLLVFIVIIAAARAELFKDQLAKALGPLNDLSTLLGNTIAFQIKIDAPGTSSRSDKAIESAHESYTVNARTALLSVPRVPAAFKNTGVSESEDAENMTPSRVMAGVIEQGWKDTLRDVAYNRAVNAYEQYKTKTGPFSVDCSSSMQPYGKQLENAVGGLDDCSTDLGKTVNFQIRIVKELSDMSKREKTAIDFARGNYIEQATEVLLSRTSVPAVFRFHPADLAVKDSTGTTPAAVMANIVNRGWDRADNEHAYLGGKRAMAEFQQQKNSESDDYYAGFTRLSSEVDAFMKYQTARSQSELNCLEM